MDLSVIIVNYNVRFFLEQCLQSVRRASARVDCEIFVVDNNSADGSCSMVTSQFPEVRLIRNRKNAGFSVANNQAIRLAQASFILLLNPDTVVEEDTFIRCLAFMKEHPEAGALGVRMIDGNGKLLPESKRGLPTPRTAFFKMSGLSALFPKSPLINKYYLGHLDSTSTTEVEIISGAFMFIRKQTLEKTGLLDEAFFMYGEDIDLSYRIIQAGYKNYYFPEVKIIHYKGESTRKSEINYTLLFYKAMIIFVKKHFSEKGHFLFLLLINTAVYFWGFVALAKNLLRRIFLILADTVILSGSLVLFFRLWENFKYKGSYHYPEIFLVATLVVFVSVTIISILLMGGYKVPARQKDTINGTLISSVLILGTYSLLPLDFRFSRFIILSGIFSSVIIIPLYRFLLSYCGSALVRNPLRKARRILIVGDDEGLKNVKNILNHQKEGPNFVGRVAIRQDDHGPEVLGTIEQIKEVIRINSINEIIFSTREMTSSQIINSMYNFSDSNVTIKIAPPGEDIIIGSNSVDFNKDIYPEESSLLTINKQEPSDYSTSGRASDTI